MPKITLQVAADSDDGAFYPNALGGAYCARAWDDFYFGYGATHGVGHATWRFVNVPLDKRYKIVTARLKLLGVSTVNASIDVHLGCDRVGNAPDLITQCDASSRTMTSAYVAWTSAVINAGQWYYSPNFAPALQEVLALPTWARGNAIAILAVQQTASGGAANCYDYHCNPAYAAQLVITYTFWGLGGSVI